MPEFEQFSMEKYLSEWGNVHDAVVVEGTLQDDGDYYVIDRDPCNPLALLRVRKSDVTHKEKSQTVHCRNGQRQLYLVSIKRGVVVQKVVMVESDSLIQQRALPTTKSGDRDVTPGVMKVHRRQTTLLRSGRDDHDISQDNDPHDYKRGDYKTRDKSQDNDPTDRGDHG
jgi:hypothetical protein